MRIELTVPWTVQGVRVACAAMTTLNRLIMRATPALTGGKRIPPLYKAGVRYMRQYGPERFRTCLQVLQLRGGDCDQLACWRAAELQEQGIAARAVPYRVTPRVMHVVVVFPDGRREDPSKRLGMKGKA